MKGYEEVKKKLESKKEEYEQAKLILEENIEEDLTTHISKNYDIKILDQEVKKKRNEQTKAELEEVLTRRKKKDTTFTDQQDVSNKRNNLAYQGFKDLKANEDKDKITVLDLLS